MSAVSEGLPAKQLLEDIQRSLENHCIEGVVHKVEISRTGDLQFELKAGGTSRWYDWNQQKPVELIPANDSKISLAARLKEKQFAAHTRLLSHRPGKRLTLLDNGGQKARIHKGFRHGQLQSMIDKYESAHMAFSGRSVNTPDIIEYDLENECLIMVCLSGERLKLSADTTDLFYLVGEALRGFQDFVPNTQDSCFDAKAELDVIDQRATRLQLATGSFPENWTALRKRLETVWRELPDPHYGLAHRDLHDKQFIQQANCLILLDFDLMTKADVCLDPANFLAHLVLRNLQGIAGATQRSIDACGKQLLLGLGRNEEPGFWRRLRFYQTTSFCRLAFVYSLRPQWQHLLPALFTMANRCLDDFDHIETR